MNEICIIDRFYIKTATKKNPIRIYPTIKRGDAAIEYLPLVIVYYTHYIIYFTYIIPALCRY
jgi:hypothetical protein